MRLSAMRDLVGSLGDDGSAPAAVLLAERWGGRRESVRYHRSSANFVFTFVDAEGRRRLLRFAEDADRPERELERQVGVMRHLAGRGVAVPAVVPSSVGADVETLTLEGRTYHAIALELVGGDEKSMAELTLDEWRAWGGAVGRLHREAADWAPTTSATLRESLLTAAGRAPAGDPVGDALRAVVAELDAVEPPPAVGVLHGDAELDNVVWGAAGPTLVDFDGVTHGWLVADLTFALRDLFDDRPDGVRWDGEGAQALLDGYRAERPLADADLTATPLLMRAHNLLTHAALVRAVDVAADETQPPWLRDLVDRLEAKLRSYAVVP